MTGNERKNRPNKTHGTKLIQIKKTVLDPSERKEGLPESTKKVPYEMRIKGFLKEGKPKVGEKAKIITPIGREFEGEVEEVNPEFKHDFGAPVPELNKVGNELREILGDKK